MRSRGLSARPLPVGAPWGSIFASRLTNPERERKHMKSRTFVNGVAALCATGLLSATLLAQTKPADPKQPAPKPGDQKQPAKPDHPEHPKAAGAAPTPEQMAMMDAWMKYATTGDAHKALAKKEGKWTIHGKMWMAPGSEPEEFDGTSTFKMILDGHYLQETVEGSEADPASGMMFKGSAWIGYDNLTKSVVTVWIDNMGTGIVRYTGQPTADWTTINFTGETPDFTAGKYKTVRSVERKVSDDQYVSTMYDTTADGKEFKHMELTYNRAGSAATKAPAPASAPASAPATKKPGN